MSEKDSYCQKFKMDKLIRLSTDNIFGTIPNWPYAPNPPPIADFFLLLDGTNFLLLDTTDLLLLG